MEQKKFPKINATSIPILDTQSDSFNPPPIVNSPPKNDIYLFTELLEKISESTITDENYKNYRYKKRYKL